MIAASTESGEGEIIPQRSGRYKYQRLRDRLRDAIRSGELSGKLPGERELARRYQANAKTINKALSDLTTEGLLVRHVGRGTFAAGAGEAGGTSSQKSLRIGWLATPSGNHAHRHHLFAQAEQLVREKGHQLVKLSAPADFDESVQNGVLKPGKLRELDGLLLFSSRPSTELLADLHRRHFPTVLANNCHDAIRTPLVLADHAHGAYELCEHLIHLGHRQVLLLIDADLLPAAAAAERGYQAAMRRHGLQPHACIHAGAGLDWSTTLRGVPQPTALVCVGGQLALSGLDHVHRTESASPGAVSIAALPEPGENGLEERGITAYEVDPIRILHWAADLLLSASPGQLPRTVIIPGQLKDRGSTVPPASRGATLTAPQEAVLS